MHTKMILFLIVLAGVFCGSAPAQSVELLPAKPTSADSVRLRLAEFCTRSDPFAVNAYHVSMARNKITVRLGPQIGGSLCPGGVFQFPFIVDLGRLPPGDYTVTVERAPFATNPPSIALDNAPFTVTDPTNKHLPYVRLDYSGHWWDPNDPGWGLFIWHGAADQILAAWFTYGTDGKPIWHVIQPSFPGVRNPWFTFASTYYDLPLYQTSRAPGTSVPPSNPTTVTQIGDARLDFSDYGSADEGKFIYTLKGGVTQTRNIRRFRP